MTALLLAVASFVALSILAMGISRRHEKRALAVLTFMGIVCLYLFIGVLLGG